MSKEYFSHDINTRSDDKMKALIRRHKMAGYGVFWAIVEDLYANANALRIDCDGIAEDLRCESDLVRSIIFDFDLFKINEERKIFSSDTVRERLKLRKAKSIKATESAHKRWNKHDAFALPPHSDRNAIKESKGKEIKVKEIKDITPHSNLNLNLKSDSDSKSTPPHLNLKSESDSKKPSKKIPFETSRWADRQTFYSELPNDWPEAKKYHYYDAALAYSNKGNSYKNWILAVITWDRTHPWHPPGTKVIDMTPISTTPIIRTGMYNPPKQ